MGVDSNAQGVPRRLQAACFARYLSLRRFAALGPGPRRPRELISIKPARPARL
jgi:hypothetical protein